ncbi:hypothetical protein BDFB_011400 [Asbolus verrucosus]|uniref:Uncharacterized protein n=1 Tax=Asbolus verrucosus TaxID=1661398 RepID=A0A482W998_ASBVE|nr:hypothetical protein BDFB_011400 [Asbolus verrucosus]
MSISMTLMFEIQSFNRLLHMISCN